MMADLESVYKDMEMKHQKYTELYSKYTDFDDDDGK